MRRALSRLAIATLFTASLAACDDRIDPITGSTGRKPPITAPTGSYNLTAVNDSALPHVASQNGVNYSLASGSFILSADSSWEFSSTEVVTSTSGTFIGNSPANYTGTWRVSDTTITLSPARGTITTKGDTLFWRGGPKHTWEDTLTFRLVRK